MPERLKSDQQLADEDVAAKIDAARLEGIRLGLMAAKRAIEPLYDPQADDILQALNPDTIAREAQDMGSEKETT
jgi:hypothetical protein